METMSFVLVGWLTQAWVLKHNDALEENVPQLTHGQTEINLSATYLSRTVQNGLFKDTTVIFTLRVSVEQQLYAQHNVRLSLGTVLTFLLIFELWKFAI